MPPYPGVSQVMEVSAKTSEGESTSSTSNSQQQGWEAEYAAYVESKYKQETADDPISSCCCSGTGDGKVQQDESWEAQYAHYCAEKERRLAEDDAKLIASMKEQASVE